MTEFVPSASVETFDSGTGRVKERSRTARVDVVAYEGKTLETAAALARVSDGWQLVAFGMARHVQFYAPTSLSVVPGRQGPGGWAGDALSLTKRGKELEVHESDNLLEFMGWRDCQFVPDDPGAPAGPGRMLRTRRAGNVLAYSRAHAWAVTAPPVVDVAAGTWAFPGAFEVEGTFPLPAPGARLVFDPGPQSGSVRFLDVDGALIGAAVLYDGADRPPVVCPAGTFFVQVRLTSDAARNVALPRLFVDDAGEPVASMRLAGTVAGPPEPGFVLKNAATAEADGFFLLEPVGGATAPVTEYPVSIPSAATGAAVNGTRSYATLLPVDAADYWTDRNPDGTLTLRTLNPS